MHFRFAEAVSRREKMAVKAFIVDMAMYKVPVKQRALESVIFDRSLCLVGQDRPTALFRTNFTPSSRYLISSNFKTVGTLPTLPVILTFQQLRFSNLLYTFR